MALRDIFIAAFEGLAFLAFIALVFVTLWGGIDEADIIQFLNRGATP